MSSGEKLTINDKNINTSIKNINYYIERIQEIFTALDNEISDISSIYNSDVSTTFVNKYSKMKTDYQRNVNNFNSYINDLKHLLVVVDDSDKLLSRKIESDISDVK